MKEEEQILDTIHYVHQLSSYRQAESLQQINHNHAIMSRVNRESCYHILYENFCEKNIFFMNILNYLGRYGSLLYVQLVYYFSRMHQYYPHQRQLKQALKALIQLGLIEELQFTVDISKHQDIQGQTIPAKTHKMKAYVLTTFAQEFLNHVEHEVAKDFLFLYNYPYKVLMQAWQFYDLNQVLQDTPFFIHGQVCLSNELYYHVYLRLPNGTDNPAQERILDLAVLTPLLKEYCDYHNHFKVSATLKAINRLQVTDNSKQFVLQDYPTAQFTHKIGVRLAKAFAVSDFRQLAQSVRNKMFATSSVDNLIFIISTFYDTGFNISKQANDIRQSFYFLDKKASDTIYTLSLYQPSTQDDDAS